MLSLQQSKSTWIAPIAISLALFGFPLFFGIGYYAGIPLRDFNTGFRVLVIGCAGLAALTMGTSQIIFRGKLSGLWWFFMAVYFAIFARVLIDGSVTYVGSMDELTGMSYWLGVTFIPALLLAMVPVESDTVEKVSRISTFVILSGLWISYLVVSVNIGYDDLGRFRVENTLNPITFGHLGVSALLLAVCGTGYRHAALDVVLRAILSAAGVYALYASASRGPVISLAVAVLVYAIFTRNNLRRAQLIIVAAVSFFFTSVFSGILDRLGSMFANRVLDNFTEDSGRLDLWSDSWQRALGSPIMGNGVSLPDGGYPHNLIIESFYSTGFGGGIAFTILCLACLKCCFSLVHKFPNYSFVALVFVQYFAMNMFSGSLWGSGSFFASMSVILAASAVLRGKGLSA